MFGIVHMDPVNALCWNLVSGWKNLKTPPLRSRVDGESAYFAYLWLHRPTPRPLAFDLLVLCPFNETICVFLCVPGESGLGKSTLVNSLFLTDLHKDRKLLNAEGEWVTIRCFSDDDDDDDDDDDEMNAVKYPLDVFDLQSESTRRWRSRSTRWTSRRRAWSWSWPSWTRRGSETPSTTPSGDYTSIRHRSECLVFNLSNISYIQHSWKPFVAQEEVKWYID